MILYLFLSKDQPLKWFFVFIDQATQWCSVEFFFLFFFSPFIFLMFFFMRPWYVYNAHTFSTFDLRIWSTSCPCASPSSVVVYFRLLLIFFDAKFSIYLLSIVCCVSFYIYYVSKRWNKWENKHHHTITNHQPPSHCSSLKANKWSERKFKWTKYQKTMNKKKRSRNAHINGIIFKSLATFHLKHIKFIIGFQRR